MNTIRAIGRNGACPCGKKRTRIHSVTGEHYSVPVKFKDCCFLKQKHETRIEENQDGSKSLVVRVTRRNRSKYQSNGIKAAVTHARRRMGACAKDLEAIR